MAGLLTVMAYLTLEDVFIMERIDKALRWL
jgi:hypothetical protein